MTTYQITITVSGKDLGMPKKVTRGFNVHARDEQDAINYALDLFTLQEPFDTPEQTDITLVELK